MERKMVRPREIAKALGISERTAYRMLEDGRLLRLRLSKRCVGTTPQSVDKLLDKAEMEGLED